MAALIPSQTPTWGAAPEHAGKIKATWLGHVSLAAGAGAGR
jgi:hypothetical protein